MIYVLHLAKQRGNVLLVGSLMLVERAEVKLRLILSLSSLLLSLAQRLKVKFSSSSCA